MPGLPIYKTSKLSPYGEEEIRTSIPLAVIDKFGLKEGLEQRFLSYTIDKHKHILLLSLDILSREAIIKLNEFFNTSEMIQRFEDIKVSPNKSKTHYIMRFNPKVISYLRLEVDTLLGYAPLFIDKSKEFPYLIVSNVLEIPL